MLAIGALATSLVSKLDNVALALAIRRYWYA
jgi:hypothetical protein